MRPKESARPDPSELLKASGLEPARLTRIATGHFNESWFATLADGRDVVLRIAPPDTAGFLFYERRMMHQEPAIHELVRNKTSIPVPRIILADFSRRLIDRDFLVMERMPGEPMSELEMGPASIASVLEELGRALRELHESCRADAYGYLGAHRPMEPCSSWFEAFRTMWGLLIEDIRACGVYDEEESRAAVSVLERHSLAFRHDPPASLLHMDVWAQNILVDRSGHLTGLVDWDRALWGDPEIEFAVLDYCGVSEEPFWRGYGNIRQRSEEARIRWAFYYLYELQKYIVIRTLRHDDPQGALRYKSAAAALLRRL